MIAAMPGLVGAERLAGAAGRVAAGRLRAGRLLLKPSTREWDQLKALRRRN